MHWKWLGIPAAILAAIGLAKIGFDALDLAHGSDVRALNRGQVENAIQTYVNTRRSLLVIEPKPGTTAHKAWEEDLNDARDKLRQMQRRKIELSK